MMNVNGIQGFHIEPTNMCTLKCPGCARTQFINTWEKHWKNYNLDIEHLIEFLDIDLENKHFLLCGNYGDPIYHPDFLNLVAELKKQKSTVKIITNGSYKNENWWLDLSDLLDSEDTVCFSIDGNPENYTQYRINADWQSTELGIKIISKSKCKSEWKFIPFNFNLDNITEVEQLAQNLGVDNFFVDPSCRYDQHTKHLQPIEQAYIGKKFKTKNIIATDVDTIKVDPICLNEKQQHFISASGYYSPCCYISDHRFYYKTAFGKNKNNFDIRNNKISTLLQKQNVLDFYSSLQEHSVCQYNCPKI